MTRPLPDTAAVVVYYRTPRALTRCLEALAAQEGVAETVVVDNSVDHHTPEVPPGCRWLRSPQNFGFARACNTGASATSAPLLLFLNADVAMRPGALSSLRARLLADDSRVMVGPRIWDANGEIELSARTFPTWRTGLLGRNTWLTRVLARHGRPPSDLAAALGPARPVDWVSGACQLIRRSAFERVSGFDEGYWMYWEDADLCRRLATHEWQVWFDPAAEVDHTTGSSGRNAHTIRAFHESAARLYGRHLAYGRIDAAMVRRVLMARAAFLSRGLHH